MLVSETTVTYRACSPHVELGLRRCTVMITFNSERVYRWTAAFDLIDGVWTAMNAPPAWIRDAVTMALPVDARRFVDEIFTRAQQDALDCILALDTKENP